MTAVNIVGGLGYLFCMLQWLWASMLFLPAVLDSGFVAQLSQKRDVIPASQPIAMSTTGTIFAIIVTALVVVVAIYVFVKMPSSIVKTGSRITHKTATITLPVITHHKTLPQKKRLQLTTQLVFLIKMVLCIIPLTALVFLTDIPEGMTRYAVVVAGSVAALCSILLFGFQAVSAKLLRIDYKDLW